MISSWLKMPIALALVCAAPTVATAAPRVAALLPQMRPSPNNELRDRFHDALGRGLSGPDLEVVPSAEVRMRLGMSEELAGCAGAGPCAARAATALRADRLVASEIAVFGKDYTVRVWLLDSAGRETSKLEDTCDVCTVKEAEDAVARAAGKMASLIRSAPAAATAAPPPPPPKPVEAPPPAPPRAAAPAPATPAPAAAAAPGPTTTAPATPERRGFPWRAVAISSAVLGVVGLAVGIPLLAIDGDPTCDAPNPRKNCPEVWNTAGGGAALVTLGVGGLVASGVLFYLDYRSRHRPHVPTVSLFPTSGGAVVTAGGRF
jgi:hypothetical protein